MPTWSLVGAVVCPVVVEVVVPWVLVVVPVVPDVVVEPTVPDAVVSVPVVPVVVVVVGVVLPASAKAATGVASASVAINVEEIQNFRLFFI